MKLKLTGSTFAALIVYMVTALIGLIQFKPLFTILISGVKFALTAFVFTLLITYAMEVMNKKAQENASKSKGKDEKEQQPPGKAGRAYDKSKASQNQAKPQEKSADKDQKTEDNTNEEDSWDFEDDFSEMEPPVIEYEK